MTVRELVTTKEHANGAEMMKQTEGLAVLAAFLAKTMKITSWVHLPTGVYVITGVMKRYETGMSGAVAVAERERPRKPHDRLLFYRCSARGRCCCCRRFCRCCDWGGNVPV